jgi:hypothetical protein
MAQGSRPRHQVSRAERRRGGTRRPKAACSSTYIALVSLFIRLCPARDLRLPQFLPMLGSLVRCAVGRFSPGMARPCSPGSRSSLSRPAPRPPSIPIAHHPVRLAPVDHRPRPPQNTITADLPDPRRLPLARHQGRAHPLRRDTVRGLRRGQHPRAARQLDHVALEDQKGRLWIGSWLGLTVYEGGQFHRFREMERSLAHRARPSTNPVRPDHFGTSPRPRPLRRRHAPRAFALRHGSCTGYVPGHRRRPRRDDVGRRRGVG